MTNAIWVADASISGTALLGALRRTGEAELRQVGQRREDINGLGRFRWGGLEVKEAAKHGRCPWIKGRHVLSPICALPHGPER